jgi:phosphoribosyl 1,2-cyclic phosphodiesterase
METGKFIGMLFQSRDMMHLQHLQTTSFAEHKALGGYYDGILELTDSFTEKYFGRNKRISIVIPEAKATDAMSHLKSMQSLIEGERNNYPSDLQNIMDEMIGLVNKTLYLLTLV